MDSRTNRRLRTIQRAMQKVHGTAGEVEDFPLASDQPLVVALPDDRIGDIFDRIRGRDGGAVIMARRSGGYVITRFTKTEEASADDTEFAQAAIEDGAASVSLESEYGMLVDLVTLNDGFLDIHALMPGYALVGV